MRRSFLKFFVSRYFVCLVLLVGLAGVGSVGGATQTTTRRVARQARSRSNIRIANRFPGADLGAKINAADKDLGSLPGEIVVEDGGVISTQVVINSGHTVRFTRGVFRLETALLSEGAFLLHPNVTIVGAGWDETIIVEPPRVGWIVFHAYDDIRSDPIHSGVTAGLRVSNLQIRGANPGVDGGVRQTVSLGNCHGCEVSKVWFNQTGVIGIAAGGNARRGHFADGVKITDNLFTGVASQAAAVVNGRNVLIDRNVFKDSGRKNSIGMTPIDLEPNEPIDIIQNITISNNLIDSRGSGFIHGNGILVQNGAGTRNFGPVVVTRNTVIGGNLTPAESGYVATGIYVAGNTQDVEVSHNTVRRVSHSGIRFDNTTRNNVFKNTVISTGSGGNISFQLNDTTDSRIVDNIVAVDPNSPAATGVIQETGKTSANNVYSGNTDGRTPLVPITLGRSRVLESPARR